MKMSVNRIKKWIGDRWRRTRIEDYYYFSGQASKNHSARRMDRLFSRAVAMVLVTVPVYLYVRSLIIGLIVGTACTFLFHRLAAGRRQKKSRKNRLAMLEKEAIDRFTGMLEDKSPGDFFEIVRELLDKSGLFDGLETVKDNEGQILLITGRFKGEKTGIYAKKLKPDAMVKEMELKEFVQYCTGRGLENGIYIANGPFDYAAREYAVGLDFFNLYIADTQTIYKAFLKGSLLFSMKDLEEQLEQKALERNHEMQHGLKKILAYRRIKTYAALSVLIAVYSVMVPYTLYYIFVSVVLLCLSLTALIRWEIEKFMEDAENSIKLDSAMDID